MENDINLVSMSFSIRLFQFLGGFPKNNEFTNPSKMFYFKFVLRALFSSVLLVSSVLHLTHNIMENIFNHIELDIAYTTAMFTGYSLMFSFLLKMDLIVQLYKELSNFKEYEKPMDFEETNQKYNKYAQIHLLYLQIIIMMSTLGSNIFKVNKCRQENEEKGIHEVCGLYLYTWLPFDIDFTPVRQIYLVWQLVSAQYIYTFIGVCSWMVFESVEHVNIRFMHSAYLYSLVPEEKHVQKRRLLFNKAVIYHKYSIRLADWIAETYSVFMFAHMFMTSVIMGYGVYAFLKTQDISTLMMSLGWLFGVFMVCHGGQRLQDVSLHVGEVVCASNWTNCDNVMQKEIGFVIMRCQRHMSLKAIFIGDVGYPPFLSVIKAAYSYIMLMYNNEN